MLISDWSSDVCSSDLLSRVLGSPQQIVHEVAPDLQYACQQPDEIVLFKVVFFGEAQDQFDVAAAVQIFLEQLSRRGRGQILQIDMGLFHQKGLHSMPSRPSRSSIFWNSRTHLLSHDAMLSRSYCS